MKKVREAMEGHSGYFVYRKRSYIWSPIDAILQKTSQLREELDTVLRNVAKRGVIYVLWFYAPFYKNNRSDAIIDTEYSGAN